MVCEATFQDLRSIRIKGNVPLAFDTDVTSDPSDYMGMYPTPRPPLEKIAAGVEVVYKTFPASALIFHILDDHTYIGTTVC